MVQVSRFGRETYIHYYVLNGYRHSCKVLMYNTIENQVFFSELLDHKVKTLFIIIYWDTIEVLTTRQNQWSL